NNHRVIAVGLGGAVTVIPIGRRQSVPLRAEAGGRLTIPVELDLGGEVLDPTQGPPVRVRVTAVPQALLGVGASEPRVLDRVPDSIDVVLGERGSGMLSVDVIASTCHDDVCTVTRSTVAHALTVA